MQSRERMDDSALLDRLRQGDHAAFDTIFRVWYAPLVRLADGMLRDPAVAEEIVQDVMLELWRRRESLDPGGSPQAYLFQSTRNRALNHLRHARVHQRSAPHLVRDEGAAAPADALAAEREIAVALHATLDRLPERTRAIFEMSRTQGLRYTEIAQALAISVKTVEAHMGRALRALREGMAPWLPDGEML